MRAARAGDLPGPARLLVRSTPSTRRGWYGRGGSVLPLVQQDAWLRRPGSLVVERAPCSAAALAATDDLPTGLRPRPGIGLRHAWSMVVPLAAAPSSQAVS